MKRSANKKRVVRRRVAPWTAEQVRDVRRMLREGVPAKRIARHVRRTEGALRQKVFALGLSFRKRNARGRA